MSVERTITLHLVEPDPRRADRPTAYKVGVDVDEYTDQQIAKHDPRALAVTISHARDIVRGWQARAPGRF